MLQLINFNLKCVYDAGMPVIDVVVPDKLVVEIKVSEPVTGVAHFKPVAVVLSAVKT